MTDGQAIAAMCGLIVLCSAATGFVGCVVGRENGRMSERHLMQQQAIERGYAEYGAKDGKWAWKVEAESTEGEQ